MPHIKFLRDYTVKSEDGESYKAGATEEMNEASCNHFVSRGVAEFVKAAPKADAPKAKAAAKKATPKADGE